MRFGIEGNLRGVEVHGDQRTSHREHLQVRILAAQRRVDPDVVALKLERIEE